MLEINKVTLSKEIEYLQQYLRDQELRFKKSIKLSGLASLSTHAYEIEAMALLPFIESIFNDATVLENDNDVEILMEIKRHFLTIAVYNANGIEKSKRLIRRLMINCFYGARG